MGQDIEQINGNLHYEFAHVEGDNLSAEHGVINEEEVILAELETFRKQSKSALESSWAEVERLQAEGAQFDDQIVHLKKELDFIEAGGTPDAKLNQQTNTHSESCNDLKISQRNNVLSLALDDSSQRSSRSYHSEGLLNGMIRKLSNPSLSLGENKSEGHLSFHGNSGQNFPEVNEVWPIDGNVHSMRKNIFLLSMQENVAPLDDINIDSISMPGLTHGTNIYCDDESDLESISYGPFISTEKRKRNKSMDHIMVTRKSEPECELSDSRNIHEYVLALYDRIWPELSQEQKNGIEQLEAKIQDKETAIETLERTTKIHASNISDLESELDNVKSKAEEKEKKITAQTTALIEDIEENERRILELEFEISQFEQLLAQKEEQEESLHLELEDIKRKIEKKNEEAKDKMLELEETLIKSNASREKYKEVNRIMKRETGETLRALGRQLIDFSPNGGEELNRELANHFSTMREEAEVLSEILAARAHKRRETLIEFKRNIEMQEILDNDLKESEQMTKRLRQILLSLEQEEKISNEDFLFEKDVIQDRDKLIISSYGLKTQEKIWSSLKMIEDELKSRLSSFEFISSHDNEVSEDISYQKTRDGIPREIEIVKPIDESEYGKTHPWNSKNSISYLEKVKKKMKKKEMKIDKLEDIIVNREKVKEQLEQELKRLQENIYKESQNGKKMVKKFRRETQVLVDQVAEKEEAIKNLSLILEQKKCTVSALAKEFDILSRA